ncbi:sugar kinase [Mucilaginibacter segetis]|uniref:Sugar kinase n=1 Tax=Mucilaginibacter segetis TaxID=2793071 RepID=A0A934PVB6_9SPHI|nr:sugar kinase [Mucilaginibacter segetis]MBK0379663.1 sugar kinase [Mucilaginibacter segetis]
MGLTTAGNGTVLTFGELLLRLSPDSEGNWLKNNQLPVYVGGAELNVATALALWGIETKYFTVLPDNGLAEWLINYIGGRGVVTSAIFKSGARLGLFYLTTGADMKHDTVVYDRAASAFAELETDTVNWDEILTGVTWFHFSAICPAVSLKAAKLCEEALIAASARDITISVDLNYRSKLWQYGVSSTEVMPGLVKYCNLIMGNIWAAESLLGIPVNKQLQQQCSKADYLTEALSVSKKLTEQYPDCKAVANTFRFGDNGHIKYYTTLFQQGKMEVSSEYNAESVIDKVGSGDCFMAGLIYGYYNKLPVSECLSFATAAAFKKLFIKGDATNSTVAQVIKAIKHDD